jgi:hypothetical protein
MQKLLWHLNATPAFLDILQAFGQRTSAENESLGGGHWQNNGDVSGESMSSFVLSVVARNVISTAPMVWRTLSLWQR